MTATWKQKLKHFSTSLPTATISTIIRNWAEIKCRNTMNKMPCLLHIFANYNQQNCALPALIPLVRFLRTDLVGNVMEYGVLLPAGVL